MTRRIRPEILLSLLLIPLLLLGSCGGEDNPTTPAGTDEQPLTPTISLGLAKAAPLVSVQITGLPADRDDLYALATVPGTGTAKSAAELGIQVFVERRDDGHYYLTTPLHPTTPKTGGMVEIQVTNGTNLNSTLATIEIEGLPEADGAFADMVGNLQLLLDGWLPVHRTTREALRNTPVVDFPDSWFPLFLAQDVIDNPDNPNSLRAIADGTAPLASGGDFDLDLLDRVIGMAGFNELLEQNVVYLDTVIAWGDTLDGGGLAQHGKQMSKGDFTISTAAELDYYMSMANNSKSRTEGAAGDVLKAAGLGVGVLGVLTPGNPVAGALGAGLWAYQTIEEAKAKMFPSSFEHSATSVEFPQTTFLEDKPGPLKWSKLMVSGKSDGLKIDKLILESIMQFAGVAGKFGKWTERFSETRQEIGKFALGEASNALIGAADTSILEIPARVWPAVDASGASYFDSKINSGGAIDIVFWDYWPEEVGQATVQVGTRSGKFGFQGTFVHQVMVVEAIQVEIDPVAKNVEPGVTVDFTATVEFAEDETLEWSTTGGTLTQTTNYTATLQTPSERWDDPIVVKVKSTTKAGIRGKPGAPERSATGLISSRKGEIFIDPLMKCVKPGKTQVYDATIVGFPPEDQEVLWLAQRGSFKGNIYTAPTSPGDDIITARSVTDPEVEGIAFVQVSECRCWFNASLVGDITSEFTGEFIVLESNQFLSVLSLAITDDTEFPVIHGQIYPGIPDGVIGDFPMQMDYSPNIDTLYLGMDDEELGLTAPILTLVENSNGKIEGFITGEVHRFGPNGIAGSVSMTIHFQGEAGLGSGGNGCYSK